MRELERVWNDKDKDMALFYMSYGIYCLVIFIFLLLMLEIWKLKKSIKEKWRFILIVRV